MTKKFRSAQNVTDVSFFVVHTPATSYLFASLPGRHDIATQPLDRLPLSPKLFPSPALSLPPFVVSTEGAPSP